jgi:hypothetical protein
MKNFCYFLAFFYIFLVLVDARVDITDTRKDLGFVNGQVILPSDHVYNDTLIVVDDEMLNKLMPLARNNLDSFNFLSITCRIK